jgi:hypothetical protein
MPYKIAGYAAVFRKVRTHFLVSLAGYSVNPVTHGWVAKDVIKVAVVGCCVGICGKGRGDRTLVADADHSYRIFSAATQLPSKETAQIVCLAGNTTVHGLLFARLLVCGKRFDQMRVLRGAES